MDERKQKEKFMEECFLKYVEESIHQNWNRPSLTDFNGPTSSFKDVARKIAKLHILFEECGIEKGDKIALCGRNSSNWGIAFMATLTYGAVVVPILHEFKPDNVHHIVNHSESKLLFAGDYVWENLDVTCMPEIDGVVRMEDFSIRHAHNPRLIDIRQHLNELFGKKYPERFTVEDVKYTMDNLNDLALINYTSGTTSASKGVMLTYRSIWSNMKFAVDHFGLNPGEQHVSMLPMAHMYGLMFEFIYQFVNGTHIHFLSRTPSPKIIADAFATVQPDLIIAVPLIIEKIIKKKVFPTLEKPHIKLLMSLPVVNTQIKEGIRKKVVDAFGGKFKELIIGGAALNKEVEAFLMSIKFPFTIGYGMTECGPLISYAPANEFVKGSCGKAIPRMEIKIDSEDPENIVGEILAKGDNVMIGYYKNEEATRATIDKDGWLHTGDLGLLDAEGNLFIKGRSKNMILGPSGQNIYPEEIEDQINNMDYVNESLVIEQEGRLVALINPDFDMVNTDKIEDQELKDRFEAEIKELNKTLPNYSQVTGVKIFHEEFEKTPKRSIKRFLYQ